MRQTNAKFQIHIEGNENIFEAITAAYLLGRASICFKHLKIGMFICFLKGLLLSHTGQRISVKSLFQVLPHFLNLSSVWALTGVSNMISLNGFIVILVVCLGPLSYWTEYLWPILKPVSAFNRYN